MNYLQFERSPHIAPLCLPGQLKIKQYLRLEREIMMITMKTITTTMMVKMTIIIIKK